MRSTRYSNGPANISRRQQHPERKPRRSGQRERVRDHTRPPLFDADVSTVKDKANHAVILDKATADKLQKDVQSYRLVTVAVLVDRLKINGSLARAAMKDLEEKGLIKKVVGHSRMQVYSKLCSECRMDDSNMQQRGQLAVVLIEWYCGSGCITGVYRLSCQYSV
jgi:small subunit ribosomal protein S25e